MTGRLRIVRLGLPGTALALWALLAVPPPAWAAPHAVTVHVATRTLTVPVPPGMTVGSPQLVSAEQSAANPVPFRLVNVFTPRNAPAPGQGARLVLVETDAGDGTLTPTRFSRVKRLATANVKALSRQAASTSTKGWNRPRVIVDAGSAFAWMAPVAEKSGSGVSEAHGLKGMLYLSVCRRILVLSPRTDHASAAEARWISHEIRWLDDAVRKANRSC